MKKIYSLTSQTYFNKVINKGKKVRSKYFLLSFVGANEFKIGISVPKKLGNAVFRNYNKRVIKAIIPKLNIYDKKFHIILIVKKDFIDFSIKEKEEILRREIEKIK